MAVMETSPGEHLPAESIHEIQMRLQPTMIDLKKASVKIEIPHIALEPGKPDCLNSFNRKQYAIVENQFNKYRTFNQNFTAVYRELDLLRKPKNI